jgi:O-antigen biosynthesis protein
LFNAINRRLTTPMATIAWLVPTLLEGSGGHRTILQHADLLQRHGHQCILYFEDNQYLSSREVKTDIHRMFGLKFMDVQLGWSNVRPADLVFATIWYSAKVVRDLPFPCIKSYFVQDYEAWFNPVGDGFLMAENSYRYGLHPICIGRWLPTTLWNRFNVHGAHFDFCADLHTYRRLPDIKKEHAVCFVFQPEKTRRCTQFGLEALGIVKHLMPDVKIYLYGSRDTGNAWFDHKHLGMLGLEECNRLYNRCAVGLCLSTSNPSRIPFEMMAAGLPVVELFRENNMYDLPHDAMMLCDSTPESLAEGLFRILNDPPLAAAMGQAGVTFMTTRPMEKGFAQFLELVEGLLQGKGFPEVTIEPMYQRSPVVADRCENHRTDGRDSSAFVSGDCGRLAFLPPSIRTVVRSSYRTMRRFMS